MIVTKNQLDKKIFGKDKSCEFCHSSFYIKPIGVGYSRGSVDAQGKWRRQAEGLLQFCVAGPSVHVKADAYDMVNCFEITHLNGVQEDTVDELFVRPEEDELEELGFDFIKHFLKFKCRMKCISHFL